MFPDTDGGAGAPRADDPASYARDTIDFLRALVGRRPNNAARRSDAEEHRALFERCSRAAAARSSSTGHYGNWEIGSLLIRRALGMPLTIVAMAEPSPDVNRIRHEIRDGLGAETIEVRQSFETALQIRRWLADNSIVAMLVDRHFGRDRVRVRFLGRDAWFLRTPSLMAHATGAPMLPCVHRTSRARQFAPQVGRADLRSPRRAARRAIQRRRSRWPTTSRRASGSTRSSGTTSIATGTPSATITTGWPDAARWTRFRTSRSAATLVALGPATAARRPGIAAAAMLGALSPDIDAVVMPFGWDRYLLRSRERHAILSPARWFAR